MEAKSSEFLATQKLEKEQLIKPLRSFKDEIKFYLFVISACVLFGSKFFFLALWHFSKIWIFFIEHIAIFWSALLSFVAYYIFYKSSRSSFVSYITKDMSLLEDRRNFYFALLSGILNAFGNICIIFSIAMAKEAGSSPAAINWILMLNIIIALWAGLCIFGESHTWTQYIGGIMIIGSVILITFERHFDVPGTYTNKQNMLHYNSVFFTIVSWVSWSMMIIITKYACFKYKADIIEYSSLAMALSGIVGCLMGIPIYYYNTPFRYIYETGVELHIILAICAGLFTTFGQMLYFAGVNLGSVEVAQLFVNMKPIVQVVEEAIFLFLFPNFWASVGIIIAILGACLVILGKREGTHQHADDEKDRDFAPKRNRSNL